MIRRDDLEKKSTNIKKTNQRSKSAKQFNARKEKLLPLPIVDKSKSNFKDNFQMEIVRYIVQNRIYKEEDINTLIEDLIKKNRGLLQNSEVEEIMENIKRELDS